MDEPRLRVVEHKTIRENVYEILKNAIISGVYKPGDRLKEKDIEDELGVSRTPVREALRQLEFVNLVKTEPYKGVVVQAFSFGEQAELFEVRQALEGFAAFLAAKRATPEDVRTLELVLEDNRKAGGDVEMMVTNNIRFHTLLSEFARNDVLMRYLDRLMSQVRLARFTTMSLPGRPEQVRREHWDILDAVRSRDPEAARKAVEVHVGRAIELILQQAEKHEPGLND